MSALAAYATSTGEAFQFWVLGTVVSRPAADRCVADCGHKSATKDHGMPVVHGIPGAAISALNDEHAVIAGTCHPEVSPSVWERHPMGENRL